MVGTGPGDSFYLPLSLENYQASVALTGFRWLLWFISLNSYPEQPSAIASGEGWNLQTDLGKCHNEAPPWELMNFMRMNVRGRSSDKVVCRGVCVPVAFVKHDRHWFPSVPLKTLWSAKKNEGVETGKWQGWKMKLFYSCLHMLCLLLYCSCLPLYPNKERLLNKWFMRITISTRRCYAAVTRDWDIDQSKHLVRVLLCSELHEVL